MRKFLLNFKRFFVATVCIATSALMYAQTTDIYVGGFNDGKATIWKNGTPEYLTESGGTIIKVLVIDGDIYAAGLVDDVAIVWKNNTILYEMEGSPNHNGLFIGDMAITGDDIYLTTLELSENWQNIAKLWINGVMQSGYDNINEMNSIFIDGNDVYIAGTANDVGIIWKNGTPLYTYDSPVTGAFASVIVVDGDVYYLGGDYGGFGKNAIKNIEERNFENRNINDLSINIWKNGEVLYTLGEEVYSGVLFFSDGVLYAVGQTPGDNFVYQAKMWVDGVGTVLEEIWSAASSIFVLDGDTYVVGFRGDYPELAAVMWVNGEATDLSNGGYNEANSIFIWQDDIGIQNIENVNIEIYPNPVKDILQVKTTEYKINKTEIIDLSGKVIYQFNNLESQINVSELSHGVYLLKLETDNGIITKKFVKE